MFGLIAGCDAVFELVFALLLVLPVFRFYALSLDKNIAELIRAHIQCISLADK